MRVTVILFALALTATQAFAKEAPVRFSTAGAQQGCLPKLEGPIPSTSRSKAYSRLETPPKGYLEEEFFISCDVQGKPYKTLVHIVRPTDAASASGILIVEPWHFGNNWTIFNSLKAYLVLHHDSTMIVVARYGLAEKFMKPADPARYGSLSLPDLPLTASEVLAQAGALAKLRRIPGLVVRHMILAGHSETGARTRQYILDEHDRARVNGKSVYDGYFPNQAAVGETEGQVPVPETDVPVIEIQGERELIADFQRGKGQVIYRRPDGPNYRLYEVPGMSHVSTRVLPADFNANYGTVVGESSAKAYANPAGWNCDSPNFTPFPLPEVKAAALDNLVRWVDQGIPAPHAPQIETADEGRSIKRDRFGNALGGVRTVYLDVPIATYTSINGAYPKNPNGPRCDHIGSYKPFTREQLQSLYPTHEDYVRKFNARLDELVSEHWYLPEDAQALRAEAARAAVP
jgi:Alpha/beta hydrolase domain